MTTLRFTKLAIPIIIFSGLLVGCLQSDYTKLVKSELERGMRHDSLLLGIKFGDSRNDFYGKCFDLNKQHLVTQGPGSASVQYLLRDSSVHQDATSIRLLFYPTFDENDLIAQMNMEFSYPAWAPWNQKFQSDTLKAKTIELLMQWYGGNQFVVASVNNTEVPVKLDGNRRVLVYIKDAKTVAVAIQDILHPYFQHSIQQGREEL